MRGRVDDSDKGRVVLAEEIKVLDDTMAVVPSEDDQGPALTCRVRVRVAEGLDARLASLRAVCEDHRGRTPLFLHVLLLDQEVVVRVKDLLVEPDQGMVRKVETLLGAGSILAEYAGRA